jgi:hypothetical protein
MMSFLYKGGTMKFLIFLLFSISFNVVANGNSKGGTIVHIASVDEAILFSISGNTETGRPACASTKRFSVHKDSVHVPVMLMAFATGKKLSNIRGLGTCSLWSNAEDVRWIEVCPLNGC